MQRYAGSPIIKNQKLKIRNLQKINAVFTKIEENRSGLFEQKTRFDFRKRAEFMAKEDYTSGDNTVLLENLNRFLVLY